MARINIEDSLYKDNRFFKLIALLKSKREALGALVEAWSLAQSYVKPDNPSGTLPLLDWKNQDIAMEIIASGLATLDGDMVTIVGATKNFAWLIQRQLAGNMGGRPKAVESGRLSTVTGSNPLTLTLPLSPSLSPTQAQSLFKERVHIAANAAHPTKVGLHELALLWNEHCGALAKVKNSNANRDRKTAAIWKQQPREGWIETIKRMADSKFCQGLGSTGWRATFDFLIQPDTWLKVNEGKYDNGIKGMHMTRVEQNYDNLDLMEKSWRERNVNESGS